MTIYFYISTCFTHQTSPSPIEPPDGGAQQLLGQPGFQAPPPKQLPHFGTATVRRLCRGGSGRWLKDVSGTYEYIDQRYDLCIYHRCTYDVLICVYHVYTINILICKPCIYSKHNYHIASKYTTSN